MDGRTTNALRGLGAIAALGVMLMAGWHVMHAPAPDAHMRPLADGGRVVGIDGWPLFADAEGVEEVVFWRAASSTLVAMNAETGQYDWESAPVRGGSLGGHAWATRDGLFVADSDGGFSGLDPQNGRQRFRRELGERVGALCRARDGLWVTLASGRTLALDPQTGGDLGARPTPAGAALLGDCEPIWGDRFPDRGAAKIAEHHEWPKLLGTDDRARELEPHPVPGEMSVSVAAYLGGSESSWVLYGARSDPSLLPMLARAGSRATALGTVWAKPLADADATSAVARGPLLAVTPAAAIVAFSFDGVRYAAVARFDLPSGRRRWEIRVTPRSLATVGASDRHVVLTWAGGSLQDGAGPEHFALMVLDVENGEKVSQIGYATERR